MSLWSELRRRNVFKVAVAYAAIAWLMIEISVTTFPMLRLPEWTATFVTVLLIIGFPVALLFAWAFELTPEGIKLEKHVDRSESITHVTSRKLGYLIIALLAIALSYFAIDKFVVDPARDTSEIEAAVEAAVEAATMETTPMDSGVENSIAVLPFVNMSDDASNEYFSDGISEEILNSLARVQDLKVAGRTSSFAFKGRNEDLRKIGQALQVSHILEGSVRKAGMRVRITAQLIKADDGFHQWSDTYERELTDIFAIQDEIAQAIFDQLKTRLSTSEEEVHFPAKRIDLSAFDLYLQAKQKIYLRKRALLEEALELLQQAVAVDADYAPAYAQLGITLLLLRDSMYGTIADEEAEQRAKGMIDLALTLDPACAEALAGLGLYLFVKGDEESSIRPLQKALLINPTLVNASSWLANTYYRLGRLQDAKRIRQELLARDPLYLPGIGSVLDDHVRDGELELAQELMDRVRPYLPASTTVLEYEGVLRFHSGRVAESMPYFESAYEKSPNGYGWEATYNRALLYSQQYETLAEVGTDEYRVHALMRLDRSEEALRVAREFAEDGDYRVLSHVLVQQGRYTELDNMIESRWPDLQAFEADYPERDGWSERNSLGLIAFAYSRLDNKSKFDEAMSRFKAALAYQRSIGADNSPLAFAGSVHAVLAGEYETALDRLARSLEGGFTVHPQLSRIWPMFEPLEGDPTYESILHGMVDRLNSERAKLGLDPVPL